MSTLSETLGYAPDRDVSNFWFVAPPGASDPIPLVYGRARVNEKLLHMPVQPGTANQNKIKGAGDGQNQVAPFILGICEGPILGVGFVWEEKALPVDFQTGYTLNQNQIVPEVPPVAPYAVGTPGGEFYSDVSVFDDTAGVWLTYTSSMSPGPGQYYVNRASPWGTPQPNGVYTFNAAQAAHNVVINYFYLNTSPSHSSEFPGGWNASSGGLWLGGSSVNGPPTTPWAYLTSNFPSQAIGYPGVALMANVAAPVPSGHMLQRSFEVYSSLGFSAQNGGTLAHWQSLPITDASAADVLTDFLTNPLHGANYPAVNLGDLSAWRSWIAAFSMFQSPVYDQQQPAREHLNELFEVTNSGAFWSDGQLKVVPYGDSAATANGYTFTPNLTPVYSVSDSQMLPNADVEGAADTQNGDLDPVVETRHDPLEAYNQVKVVYSHRANDYGQDWVVAEDQPSQALNGQLPAPVMTLRSVTDPVVAQQVAQARLQRDLYVRNTYTFRLGWPYALLEPMDVVDLTDAALGLSATPVRITAVDELDNEQGFAFTAEAIPAGVFTAAQYATGVLNGGRPNFNTDPGDTLKPLIVEAPQNLITAPYELWFAGSGGPNWAGAQVWVSTDDVNFAKLGSIQGTATYGMLNASLSTSAYQWPVVDTVNTLSVTVTSGTTLATLSAQQFQQLQFPVLVFEQEDVPWDLTTGDEWAVTEDGTAWAFGGYYSSQEWLAFETATLVGAGEYHLTNLYRGLYGTVPESHASGQAFLVVDDNVLRVPWNGAQSQSALYFKFLSFNQFGLGTQALADVESVEFIPQVNPHIQDISIPQGTASVNSNGSVSATADGGSNILSWRWAASTSAFPDDATTAASGTISNALPLELSNSDLGGPLEFGQTLYVTIVPFPAPGATGFAGLPSHLQVSYTSFTSTTKTVTIWPVWMLDTTVTDSGVSFTTDPANGFSGKSVSSGLVSTFQLASAVTFPTGVTLTQMVVQGYSPDGEFSPPVVSLWRTPTGSYPDPVGLGSALFGGTSEWSALAVSLAETIASGYNYNVNFTCSPIASAYTPVGAGSITFTYTMPDPKKAY